MTIQSATLKNILILFLILNYVCTAQTTQNELKTISGNITHLDMPLAGVNIKILNSTRGTQSDQDGLYEIKVKTGEILRYSYVGMTTVDILIEDVTEILNIRMLQKTNELDEVVVQGFNKVESVTDIHQAMNVNLQTAVGQLNPARIAKSVHYLNKEQIRTLAQGSMVDALNGRFSNLIKVGDPYLQPRLATKDETLKLQFVKYDIDGFLHETDPGINFNDIEHMWIIKSKALIVIRTKNSQLVKQQKLDRITELNKNQTFYQDDAMVFGDTMQTENTSNKVRNARTKRVSGILSSNGTAVGNVSVTIKDKPNRTISNNEGYYTIDAKPGEVIQFSHIAYKPVAIVVEDVTETINIKMVASRNDLDEVVVTAINKRGQTYERAIEGQKTFNTAMGEVNPLRAGYSIPYIKGEDINDMGFQYISQALNGKFAGLKITPDGRNAYLERSNSFILDTYVVWDVDGMIYTEVPPINMSNVKEIRLLKSLVARNLYGSVGANGVVVIKTKSADFNSKVDPNVNPELLNKEFYANDALDNYHALSDVDAKIETLKSIGDSDYAKDYYNNNIKDFVLDYPLHLQMARLFLDQFSDETFALDILKNLWENHMDNPEILKAIAYHCQEFGFKKEAIKIYKNVFYLRPNYAQSYRDAANAFIENEQFTRGWHVYMFYLIKGFDISSQGIGNMIYNEMEYLYFNRSNQTKIKQVFVPKNENHELFKNDMRFVFEWNTSEAEFDLEFVNPEKRAYGFRHTLTDNEDLIIKEKTEGYSSMDLLLEEIGDGEWLINLTYLGNKKPEPTYFKFTTYYNWGQFNQRSEIKVYQLDTENKKIQLLKINKDLLIASN